VKNSYEWLGSGKGPEDILDRANFGKRKLSITFKNLEKLNIPIKDFYNLNSHGLRSDEFLSSHEGKHILFAGCSVTTGEGLPLKDTWAHKLYTQISSSQKTSGYFNISYPGASILGTIKQIYLYVENFGSPDCIFALLPNIVRDTPRDKRSAGRPDEETYQRVVEECKNLEKFCLKNKIRLFVSGWELREQSHFRSITSYKAIDHTKLVSHVYEFSNSNSSSSISPFLVTAMDGEHAGIAVHDYYKQFFYNLYLRSYSEDNRN
jgi:hypothetical protein